nr:non-structural polyprotein [Goose astrovirus 1]UYR25369.1 non-structural polyprotein [Goose astrovirus 1]
MASCGDGAFGSLDKREARLQTPAGLDKIFSLQGVVECFDRMRVMYGDTPAWRKLMATDAIYIKDLKTAIGIHGTAFGLFMDAGDGNATWSDDAGAAIVTRNEAAALRAQQAKVFRLRSAQALNSSLTHTIMEKTRLVKEKARELEDKNKEIVKLVESQKKLIGHIEEKHRDQIRQKNEEIGNLKLKLVRAEIERDKIWNEKQKIEEMLTKSKAKKFCVGNVLWIVLAFFFFSFLATTQAADDNPNLGFYEYDPDKMEKTCKRPEFGCLLVNGIVPVPTYDFETVMAKCYNMRGNFLMASAFNPRKIIESCAKSVGFFMDRKDYITNWRWCERRLQTLVPAVCEEESSLNKIWVQIYEALEQSRDLISYVKAYNLDVWIIAIFSLMATGNKEKFLKMVPFVAIAWWFQLPTFLLTVAVNIFPTIVLPFVAFQVIFPDMLVITTFLMWMTLVLRAFFWNEGVNILVETSYSLLYVFTFIGWSFLMTLFTALALTVPLQILLFCVVISMSCGTRYAMSTITITHPDGTTEKTTRIAKVKRTVVDQVKKGFKQLRIRGVIPSSPIKSGSIVIIEGKNGSGTGWRFMNYICTAGHVVRGSDFVTVKSENICVRCKIWKEIEIFESVDTLVLIKLPKELQMVKPLKLAKEIVNDYLTLTTWDANFQNQISFQGWCTIDGNWISNTMNTAFGNSGAPYTNSDGRLVGMHLGTQGVISQGVVVKHILESNIMVQQSQHIDVDELMEKVIAGTKISHAEILKQLDELREKVSIMEGKMKNYDDFWLMQTILGQKKKGKTKKTVRGAKHLYTKKLLSKGHFMKMRMLTDEEYNRMIEEGFSADEIRDAVNHLREQAWLNYCIENDIDEDGVEDWYDEMIADDIANEEIDRKIEEAMEEENAFLAGQSRKTYIQQALLHIIRIKKDRVKTVKLETQAESAEKLTSMFEKAVSDQEIQEGTSVAILSNGEDVRVIENKEIDFKKIKMIPLDDEKTSELIKRDGCTKISTGEDNKKNILKEKTTVFEEPKNQPLEQRKKCNWCMNPKPHNYAACKRRNQKCFCVFCGIMHSENEGHTRPVECPSCKKGFKGVEGLEAHAIEGCPKN